MVLILGPLLILPFIATVTTALAAAVLAIGPLLVVLCILGIMLLLTVSIGLGWFFAKLYGTTISPLIRLFRFDPVLFVIIVGVTSVVSKTAKSSNNVDNEISDKFNLQQVAWLMTRGAELYYSTTYFVSEQLLADYSERINVGDTVDHDLDSNEQHHRDSVHLDVKLEKEKSAILKSANVNEDDPWIIFKKTHKWRFFGFGLPLWIILTYVHPVFLAGNLQIWQAAASVLLLDCLKGELSISRRMRSIAESAHDLEKGVGMLRKRHELHDEPEESKRDQVLSEIEQDV